jgi:hypothetical protein
VVRVDKMLRTRHNSANSEFELLLITIIKFIEVSTGNCWEKTLPKKRTDRGNLKSFGKTITFLLGC